MGSYVTTEEAVAYFGERLGADAWDGASEIDRTKALATATRVIDRQIFKGRKADPDQVLSFPRAYEGPVPVAMGTAYVQANFWWVEEVVPQAVKDATCEQALFLLSMTDYDRDRQRQHTLGMVGSGLGQANEYSAQAFVAQNRKGAILCPDARDCLRPVLAGTVKMG